jgi:hypothetical protein
VDDLEPEPLEVLGLLADLGRLRVFAALVLGMHLTSDVIAEQAQLTVKDTLKLLSRLESGGLARRDGDGWRPCPERLREIVTTALLAADEAGRRGADDLDPAEAAVLRAFFRNGRLTHVPAQQSKRMIVLDHIARSFEPGVRYAERRVNEVLSEFHPDYAALRRHLVDAGFLGRAGGVYWRTGGTFLV